VENPEGELLDRRTWWTKWAQRLSESFGPALREGAASLINAPQPEDDGRSRRITVGITRV